MKYAVLDFETTGSGSTDEIIQVGLVIIDEFQMVNRYTSLVNPSMSIPSSITALTGITDEMVLHAPTLDQVMPEIFPLLLDCVLVGHHIPFDLAFLQRALSRTGFPSFTGRVLDTMDMLRILFPSLTSFQLSMVCHTFGIEHERPHQADSDADVTAQIWIQCMQKLVELPLLTVQRLSHILDAAVSDLGWFLDEIRRFKEMETSIDMDTHRYFRQFAINVEDWGDETPVREDHAVGQMDDSFESFYGEVKHNLQERFANYEDRDAQEQMITEVEASFQKDRHLMIEAGTGTGKSLGYLIPSLYYGLKQDKKVLISTHTINLQEQLRDRDIPLLHDIFPAEFRAAILKGRSHYLCLRKFEHKINLQDYENGKEDPLTAAQMVVWLSETMHGDEEELHFGNKGAQFWHTVGSDTDSCLNRQCPWFKKCFYHRARNGANLADVVITNHSLLFTDMKAENRLLPHYKHLVIDEAHHFEEVASKHLGIELQYNAFHNTLLWLFKDSRSGQLPMLRFRLQKVEEDRTMIWCQTIDMLYPKVILIKEEWDRLSEKLYELLAYHSDPTQNENGQYVYRIKSETLPPNWDELAVMEDNIFLNLNDILKALEKLMLEIKEVQEEFEVQSVLTDLGGILKELYRHRDALHFFMKLADEGYVYWMEASTYAKSKSLQLISVPTDVSPMLQEYFFSTKDSIVLTSATLSVDKSFQYSCQLLGLKSSTEVENQSKLKTVQLPSPFNYREQALVCIPRDFPGIKGSSGDKIFIDALIDSLSEVAMATKGRMLVLFTSNRMLKQTYNGLKERLKPHGIGVLGQGVDSGNRSKLTRMFQESKASVLLGTSSFWEGVDIPGDALSCLAIVRLPFQPPNHPLVEAKCENLKKNNLNPFMKFSVPQAVIRFKQGFGRLVRTATDKGIVIIYDTRVIDTQYGKYFLYSLPGPKIEHMNTSQMIPRIQEWMGGERNENA